TSRGTWRRPSRWSKNSTMGFTERLARACAARPRRTFVGWGIAVLVALALVATSLHGLSSNGNVIGKPESTKAADEIAKAFPREAAAAKGDGSVVRSKRFAINGPRFLAFAKRNLAALRATGDVNDVRVVAVSPAHNSALISVLIKSDSGAKSVEQVVANANGHGFTVGITGYHSSGYDF